MADYSQSVLSTQYVQVPVTAFGTAGTYNPAGDRWRSRSCRSNYPVTEPSSWATGIVGNLPGPGVLRAVPRRARRTGAPRSASGRTQIVVKITDPRKFPVLQPTLLTITP